MRCSAGLKDVEADVLARVLQAKTAPAAPPVEAVTMLAAAVAKAGDAGHGAEGDSMPRPMPRARCGSARRCCRVSMPDCLRLARAAAVAARWRGGGGGGGGGGNNVGLPGLSTPGARPAADAGPRRDAAGRAASRLTKLAAGTDELAPLAKTVANKVDWTGKPAPPPPPAVAPLTADEQKRFEAGKEIFLGLCAGCHNDDGQGKEKLGANLVTSKYVQAGVAFPIRILTQGKEGPIGLMPPVTGMLSDEQIAAALTLHPPRVGTHGVGGDGERRARNAAVADAQRAVDGSGVVRTAGRWRRTGTRAGNERAS